MIYTTTITTSCDLPTISPWTLWWCLKKSCVYSCAINILWKVVCVNYPIRVQFSWLDHASRNASLVLIGRPVPMLCLHWLRYFFHIKIAHKVNEPKGGENRCGNRNVNSYFLLPCPEVYCKEVWWPEKYWSHIGSKMNSHFIRYSWNKLCVFYPRASGEEIWNTQVS